MSILPGKNIFWKVLQEETNLDSTCSLNLTVGPILWRMSACFVYFCTTKVLLMFSVEGESCSDAEGYM